MQKHIIPLFMGAMGIGLTEFIMMGILPDIASSLHISIPLSGHLISAYAFGVVMGAPLILILSNKFAPKQILILLLVMFTIFNALSASTHNYYLLILFRFCAGLPHGCFFGVGAIVAMVLAKPDKKTTAVANMFLGLTLANVIGVPIGTFLSHHFSWNIVFIVVGFIGLITILLSSIFIPNLPKQNTPSSLKNELKVFKKSETWLVLVLCAIGCGGLFAWFSFIGPLMIQETHLKPQFMPYIMSLAGVGMTLGLKLGAFVSDKRSPIFSLIFFMLLLIVSLGCVFLFAHNLYLSLIFVFITGLCSFAYVAPLQVIFIQVFEDSKQLGATLTHGTFNIGNGIGAYLGGLSILYTFSYASPSLAGAGLAFIGLLIAILLAIKTKSSNSLKLRT
ncbi:MFS transporter [Paraphotobacterium marinum]|uniref:MFS transporter n=1 Tax=Paraphotobacterium marinum TaxID=1755811 RepID=A0A220VG66_9GAMM|nr:MFS transporter [Paraphotobacterium marinum]ASK79240.1 MFS transporter [Paraphotobacterium marinum]